MPNTHEKIQIEEMNDENSFYVNQEEYHNWLDSLEDEDPQ